MNEQLSQLALKAKDYAYVTIKNYKDKSQEFEEAYLEKFAELIVQECINNSGENLSRTDADALKIHFGVE